MRSLTGKTNSTTSLCILLLTVIFVTNAAALSGRVVNGTDARVENYPFVVALCLRSIGALLCGGSIISNTIVMTAAHCTDGRSPDELAVQFGVTNISSSGDNTVPVTRIIQHEHYSRSQNYANDIALLQVAHAFVYNYKTVAPVQLPEMNFKTPQVEQGGSGILIGWGLNEPGGQIQQTLQQVILKIYSDQECAQRHGATVNSVHHICGGVDEGGKGQCSGDSGGPLLYQGTQVGIVSWSLKPCTVAGYPGVYCKVASYIDWILQKRKELE